MSAFKINEAALRKLISSPVGPVGREVERRAVALETLARGRVGEIMHHVASVVDDVQHEIDPVTLTATIGIRDRGEISEYLEEKANNPKEGTDSWLFAHLPTVFPPKPSR